jgi:hypothetical protein
MDLLLSGNWIAIGEHFRLTFQRTLRIPDDGRTYPLPPGLGRFPILAAAPFSAHLPPGWRGPNSFLIPMYQREALWLGFNNDGPPLALSISIGKVNAISGRVEAGGLHSDPQDYVVCPEQLWLDGINAGQGSIRQFVAMPLGKGYTVEAAITGKEESGGIQIAVYEPKPGAILKKSPEKTSSGGPARSKKPTATMGLGAGGRISQKIYPDPNGIEVWDQTRGVRCDIHIVNSLEYREITGEAPPPTPIDASAYTKRGYPWFDLWEENKSDVSPPEALANLTTIAERDEEIGHSSEEHTVELDPRQVIHVVPDP